MADVFVDSAATGANDGSSWTDAYTSLNTALAVGNVVAGNIVLCTGTVLEQVDIAVAGTAAANIIVRGDDGTGTGASPSPAMFTIDGDNGNTNCVVSSLGGSTYYKFIDIRCTNSNNKGWDFTAEDYITFINCQADLCDQEGFKCDNYIKYIHCTSFSNTGTNFRCDTGSMYLGCLCYSGSADGIMLQHGLVANCLSYKNNGRNIYFVLQNLKGAYAINNTVDGDRGNIAASAVGVFMTSDDATSAVINCLFHDCDYAINGNAGVAEQRLNYYNLMSDTMGADLLDFEESTGGQVDAAPGFVDEVNSDYRLASGSAAKAAGLDAGLLVA